MAEKRVLRMCRLLGDSTRLRIYSIVKSRPMGATVKEVAKEVNLHPNVARLHLSKLEKESLLVSKTLPTRSKGRPQRLYLSSNATVEISVPHRDYSLLSKLLLEIIEPSEAALERVHDIGVKIGRRLVSCEDCDVTEATIEVLKELGFEPELVRSEEKEIEIQTGNCIFQDTVDINPAVVCRFHHALTEGIAAQASKAPASVSSGDYRCRQVVRLQDV